MFHLGRKDLALLAVLAAGACSSNFSGNGTQTASNPMPPVQPGGVTAPQMPQVSAKLSKSGKGSEADTATLPFSQAPTGLQCPTVQGFSCLLKFNMPSPSPSPSAKEKRSKHKAAPTPSPSPTPSPTPAVSESPSSSESPSESGSPAASGSPHASASPAAAQVTLQLEALPNDAPAMHASDDKKPAVAVLAVRMQVDADETIAGGAEADFTLPQDQLVKDRGFAIQLFHEIVGKHNKHTDTYIGSFSTFDLKDDGLHFAFDVPQLAVKKGETWLFVLYGDALAAPSGSASPSGSPSTSEAASPSASPTDAGSGS